MAQRGEAWGCLLVVIPAVAAVLVACGAGGSGRAASPVPATTTTTSTATGATSVVARSAPRWETVTTLEGTGRADTGPFTILANAIQWRVRWTCETGTLRITSDPPPRKGRPVAEGTCPGKGDGFAIHTGSVRLTVQTDGPWKAVVDQQIDVPLVEDPLPGMTTDAVVASGPFGPLEMEGKGTARLYQLPGGDRALRFEDDFEVGANTDLFVWLSEAEAPATSEEAFTRPYVNLGNLKSTLGSQNYVLPADLATEKVRSVVIWCEPVAIAYADLAVNAACVPPARPETRFRRRDL